MKLITHIEYHTVWGQELFLRAGDKVYPMKYTPGDIWVVEIPGLRRGRIFEYRYEVHQGGLCTRTEWLPHRVMMQGGDPSESMLEILSGDGRILSEGKNAVEVRDFWSVVPSSLPLHSAPFAEGVFHVRNSRENGTLQIGWKAAGTAVPVFSLRSERSFGVGEFRDLKLLVDWAVKTGQKVIQLLPVNDTTMSWTWADSYPYNANSSFALHPQFLHLPAAGVDEDEEYLRLRKELNALPELDYERVNLEKHRLLRKAFEKSGKETLTAEAFKAFFNENQGWLLPYAVYSVLRDRFGTADFTRWERFAEYDNDAVRSFASDNQHETAYWYFVQYHLHVQLLEARNYAHSKGVIFKGDLPIGVSRTSVDAWTNARLFNMDSQAGAPPDAFSEDGQVWGFPTYNWEEMSKDGYAWWKSRLGNMSRYFDAFRIDHILGFFRIWEIPLDAVSGLLGHFNPAMPYRTAELESMGFRMKVCTGKSRGKDVLFVPDPKKRGYWHPRIAAQNTSVYSGLPEDMKKTFDSLHEDFFYRRHNGFWKESAMKKLPSLLTATGMLACGEDLGMIPGCVPDVMSEYQILSLEIQRMSKKFGERFADPAAYPYYSVCTTSTHDMNPLRAWWEEDRDVTEHFWKEVLGYPGEAPVHCEPWICRRIIEMNLESPSMLVILPLQDWLSTDGELRLDDPFKERINIPARPRHYWRYRMHQTLECLLRQDRFNAGIMEMVSASGR